MKKIAIIYLIISTALSYFIGTLFIDDLSSSLILQKIYWGIHLLLVSSVVLAPFSARLIKNTNNSLVFRLYQKFAYQLMGFYFLLIFIFGTKKILAHFIDYPFDLVNMSWWLLITCIVLTIVGLWSAKRTPTIIKTKIKVEDKFQDLKNIKIVQISDVHVSQSIRIDFVEKIVAISNSLKPDFVMLTGDFVDGHLEDIKSELVPFKNLISTYGSFYVPGNHEYYWGVENWIEEFKKLNCNVLLNTHQTLKIKNTEVIIGGVHDLAANRMNPNYRCDPDEAFRGASLDSFKILLAHQPKTISLIKRTKVNLMLSGHTHAGQFFPASLLIFLFQPYVKGLHKVQETWLYINQGTGFWGPPNRLGTKSEISLIEFI